jgi:dsRNA-specific ribonuclease
LFCREEDYRRFHNLFLSKLIQESRPSQIKKYTTKCIFGDLEAIGEGKSKKESKKNSAIKMLEELKRSGGSINGLF